MSLRSILETFDASVANAHGTTVSDVEQADAIAAARAHGFESGYASGWEDSQKTDEVAHNRVAAEFERNIETLAFTYHEAVDLIRAELFGFIDAIVETFLPPLLPDLTREHVRDSLRKLGASDLITPVELVVSPDCRSLVEDMMSVDFSLELDLVEDATLAPHQVFLRLTTSETSIDLAPLVEKLKSQIKAMNQEATDEEQNVGTCR